MSDVEGDAVVSNPKKKLKTGTLCVETQTQVQEKKAAESQTEDVFPGPDQREAVRVMPPPDLAFADASHVAIADASKDQPLYKDEETMMNGGRISPKRKGRYEKKQLPDSQLETLPDSQPETTTPLPDSQPETTTPLPDNDKQKTEIVSAHPDIDNAPSVEKDVQKDSIKETS